LGAGHDDTGSPTADGNGERENPAQTAEAEARTMADLAATTSHRACGSPITLEAVRAEALFASTLQSSQSPVPDQVRHDVAETLRRLGTGGCAAWLAGEFGDHPEAAVARMAWALATIRSVYPTDPPASAASAGPSPASRPLATAS
jgi:hypothetical protein